MGLELDYIGGQTPIDDDEKIGLRIPSITMKSELDEFEQQNIENAIQWTLSRSLRIEDILNEGFLRDVHRRMFSDVWIWAGTYRQTNKNIGVDKYEIGIELRKLLDDCRYWIDHMSFNPDEIAVRFSHRLVLVHCFPNGNGRHSRLIADVLIHKGLHQPVFTWGRGSLVHTSDARSRYLTSLRKADEGDYTPLITFARS